MYKGRRHGIIMNHISLNRATHFVKRNIVYIGHVGSINVWNGCGFDTADLYKYGITNNVYRRVVYNHKKRFEQFDLLAMKETVDHKEVERLFTKVLRDKKMHVTMQVGGHVDRTCRELFYLKNPDVEFENIVDLLDVLCRGN
jgi:hypothetical protein